MPEKTQILPYFTFQVGTSQEKCLNTRRLCRSEELFIIWRSTFSECAVARASSLLPSNTRKEREISLFKLKVGRFRRVLFDVIRIVYESDGRKEGREVRVRIIAPSDDDGEEGKESGSGSYNNDRRKQTTLNLRTGCDDRVFFVFSGNNGIRRPRRPAGRCKQISPRQK